MKTLHRLCEERCRCTDFRSSLIVFPDTIHRLEIGRFGTLTIYPGLFAQLIPSSQRWDNRTMKYRIHLLDEMSIRSLSELIMEIQGVRPGVCIERPG
jgi:hypothetical protein